jgi:hypothetical protein
MSLGFWAGANAFLEEKEAQKIKREEFLMEQLEKTKSLVIPELIARLDKKKAGQEERKSRVAQAQLMYKFSRRSALALEKTGQLEFELEKLSKMDVSGKYIEELTGMIENKLDPKDPDYDEILAKAVQAGLDTNMITDDERLEGLLAAIHATDKGELDEALIDLLPTQESETLKPSRINYNQLKGAKTKDTTAIRVRNNIAERIAPMLKATIVRPDGNTGLESYSFNSAKANEILLKVTDSIVEKFVLPQIGQEEEELIRMASNIVQDYSNLVKEDSSYEEDPEHFDLYFDEIFMDSIKSDQANATELWKQKLNVPEVTTHTHSDGTPPHGGHDGDAPGHGHASPSPEQQTEEQTEEPDPDFEPELPEPLQVPTT